VDVVIWASCIPCMKRGPGGRLEPPFDAWKNKRGWPMVSGTCGGCGRHVVQTETIQKFEAVRRVVESQRKGAEQGSLL